MAQMRLLRLNGGFPRLGIPLWGPHDTDQCVFGAYVRFPLFREAATPMTEYLQALQLELGT